MVWNHPPNFNIAFKGKCDSTYVISNKDAGLAITYDVTSRDDCTEHNTSSETAMTVFSTDDTARFVALLK